MGRLALYAALVAIICLLCIPAGAQEGDQTLDSMGPKVYGPDSPWRVKKVEIKGLKEPLSAKEADGFLEMNTPPALSIQLAPEYDSTIVRRDKRRILQYCKEQGFFAAKVEASEKRDQANKMVEVIYTVEQGPPTVVEKTEFIWLDPDAKQIWQGKIQKLLLLKDGQRFQLPRYQQTKQAMIKFLANQAHPNNQVQGQVRVYPNQKKAVILYKIDPGPRLLFGNTQVKGNQRAKQRFILTEVVYARGQPFSLKSLEETQRALLNTGLFSVVNLKPDYKRIENNQVPIDIAVEERDAHSIQLGVGWGTEDHFRVSLQQTNRNILGLNETLSFTGKISSIYAGLVGNLVVPHIFNRRSTSVTRGGLEQRDRQAYINNRLFFNPAVEYVLDKEWSWFAGYNMERDRMKELKTKVPDPAYELQTFFISSFPMGLIYDTRDSLLDTTRGTYARLEVEVALKAVGSEIEFIRPIVDARHVIPLPVRNWYLALRAGAGLAYALPGTDQIPMIRRFFPGGPNSVRGYPYERLGPLDDQGKPYGGEAEAIGSVEVRFPIWRELGGVVFVDAGNAWLKPEDVFKDTGDAFLRYTTGFGLRYNTPVGPIRLDWGYQLNPPDAPISRWEAYLSVGQAF